MAGGSVPPAAVTGRDGVRRVPGTMGKDSEGKKVRVSAKGNYMRVGPDGKATINPAVGKVKVPRTGPGNLKKLGSGFANMAKNIKGMGMLGGLIGLGHVGYLATQDSFLEASLEDKLKQISAIVGGTLGGIAGSGIGLSLGAALGSVIPGLGTVAGGILGTILGGMGGAELGDAIVYMLYYDKLPPNLAKELREKYLGKGFDGKTGKPTQSRKQIMQSKKANMMDRFGGGNFRKDLADKNKKNGDFGQGAGIFASVIGTGDFEGAGFDGFSGFGDQKFIRKRSTPLTEKNIQKTPPTFEELRKSGEEAARAAALAAGTNIVNAQTEIVNNQSTQGIIGAPVSLIDISLAAGMARHGGTVFA